MGSTIFFKYEKPHIQLKSQYNFIDFTFPHPRCTKLKIKKKPQAKPESKR